MVAPQQFTNKQPSANRPTVLHMTDPEASNRARRDRLLALAVLIPALFLLSGCDGKPSTPVAQPLPTLTIPPIDMSSCGSLATATTAAAVNTFYDCQQLAFRNHDAEVKRLTAAHKAEVGRVEAANRAAHAEASKSPLQRLLRWQLLAAIVAFIGGMCALRRDPAEALKTLPHHRHPQGPAGGALVSAASAQKALGWFGIALAAPLLGSLFSIGTAVLAGIPAGLIAWAAYAAYARRSTEAAGYRIADEGWMRAASEAEMSGQPIPSEHAMDRAAAHSLGLTKGFVAPEKSAATAMLGIDGTDRPVREAWARISHALALGTTDPESGSFTPWATIAGISHAQNGDVTVTWDLHERAKTAKSFQPAEGPLLRELRVKETVGGFLTNVETGQVFAVFSNGSAPAAPAAPPINPVDDWKF